MRYSKHTTADLLAFCTARERNDDPVPVDLIAELGERGIICSSSCATRELQFAKTQALIDYITD